MNLARRERNRQVFILRYQTSGSREARIGMRGDDGRLRRLPVSALSEVLTWDVRQARRFFDAHAEAPVEPRSPTILAPIDDLTEVWASGVTYQVSRQARMEESGNQRLYQMVYEASRPELFFKSVAWRVVADQQPIGIRTDSKLNVAEPEMALVINSFGEILGLTCCNDVSSRSIEGENPLYLPQAKIYAGSCAVGPWIRPIWEFSNPDDLRINLRVVRDDAVVWSASTSTSLMNRDMTELVKYLFHSQHFPHGAILATGTGIAPDLDFSLQENDVAEMNIEQIGSLTNPVSSADTIIETTGRSTA